MRRELGSTQKNQGKKKTEKEGPSPLAKKKNPDRGASPASKTHFSQKQTAQTANSGSKTT